MRILLLASSLVLVACSGSDDDGTQCGPGTHEEDGLCVPDDSPGADASTDPDADTVPDDAKRVFVTRTTYEGNLGGLEGADTLCQNAASAVGLDGSFKAWLSDFDSDAIDRITGDGPWYDLADSLIFGNHAALATSPAVGIMVQENGEALVISERVWTGTAAGGTGKGSGASDFCGEWFSPAGDAAAGSAGATDGAWTDAETLPCNNSARLYCFEL